MGGVKPSTVSWDGIGALGARGLLGPTGLGVPHVEDVLLAAGVLDEVLAAQEAARVEAHEEREVGLLAHVVDLELPARPDVTRHREAEGRVGPGLDGEPLIRVNRRGRVLGIDDDQLGAVVLRLVEEVGVGDLGHRGVHHPDDEVIGEEPLVAGAAQVGEAQGEAGADVEVADLGPGVGEHPTGLHLELEAAYGAGPVVVVGAQILVDGVGAVALGDDRPSSRRSRRSPSPS